MPRPSLKDKRQVQILDAFVRVAARHGIEGATQALIAAEAGVQRPILRHYLGNKEEMVEALFDHVLTRYQQMLVEFDALLPKQITGAHLVSGLFAPYDSMDTELALVFQAMAAYAPADAALSTAMVNNYGQFYDILADRLRRAYPHANPEDCSAAARGIGAMYLEQDSTGQMAPPATWRAQRERAAMMLVNALAGA